MWNLIATHSSPATARSPRILRRAICVRLLMLAAICGLLWTGSPASARDIFERHSGDEIAKFLSEGEAVPTLSMDAAARLKPLSATVTTPCIAVRTDSGNVTKALVTWGFRKTADQPVPVLLIERFVTYRGDLLDQAVAAGEDVMVFAGFSFDFDIGQVVPADFGAEFGVSADGTVNVAEKVRMIPLNGSLVDDANLAEQAPRDHEGVRPTDFSGAWQVHADGRWPGTWELSVNERGQVSGVYISEESRSRYDITGRVAALPHNAHLEIFLANAQQSVDAYLWTTNKDAMAGTVSLAGRKFGFYAVRITNDAADRPARD